ncbi:hypothetical protein NDU88_003519 [Pleurodeles waltl]|uniref:Uncharacterized protein n=1 Tax=Pleurodeles waltl TaxID=8319 RepID=A0AAV7W2F3_PLEWA|nr:hypothetical protein NDU88_003519 [Pleurodeles waltl]
MESSGAAQEGEGQDERTKKDMGLVGPLDLSLDKEGSSKQEAGAQAQNIRTKRKQTGEGTSKPRGDAAAQVDGRRGGGMVPSVSGVWEGQAVWAR